MKFWKKTHETDVSPGHMSAKNFLKKAQFATQPPLYNYKLILKSLESAMATLSTGIVGISDKIGKTNVELVNRSMMIDGKILRPSRPIAIPDYLIPKLETYLESGERVSCLCSMTNEYFYFQKTLFIYKETKRLFSRFIWAKIFLS